MPKAFSIDINPNSRDSHQSAPWCLILVTAFTNPQQDGLTKENSMVTEDLIIDNDVLRVQTSSSKGEYQTSANVTLASGKYNYQSKVSPGDHIFVWMGDDSSELQILKKNIDQGSPCNYKTSGLKFFGRITSVRTNYTTQANGVKTTRYTLSLSGFSELGATIYYNPLLYDPSFDGQSSNNRAQNFISGVSSKWRSLLFNNDISGGDYLTSQSFVEFFLDVFLGKGPEKTKVGKDKKTSSTAFLIPQRVAEVFGSDTFDFYFSDIFYRILGIQQYDGTSYYPVIKEGTNKTVFKTQTKVVGNMLTPPETFDSTIWSLINSYKNPTLNECYNTLKINKNGSISPHFILRQIPFSTDPYNETAHTKFTSLPKWSISENWPVYSFNIGNSDASRFNFFSVFGHFTATDVADPNLPKNYEQHQSIIDGNLEDYERDIERSGPRNMMTTVNTNFVNFKNQVGPATWTRMISDWYKNGHLKLNGTIECAGISLPVCVGDNLQIASKLFHIESVTHAYIQDENSGARSFSTSIALSHGIAVDPNLESKEINNIKNQFSTGISDGNK